MHKDPYKVLGLAPNTPFAEVRAEYFRLARKHHPDKVGNVSIDERKQHEERFKDITNAYDAIEKGGKYPASEDDNSYTQRDWREVWARVENLFQQPDVWDCMKRVIKSTVVDVAAQVAEDKKRERLIHTVCMPIKLEELHRGKVKKVQIFLQQTKQPIMCKVSCSDYPKACITVPIDGEDHTVYVHMKIEQHNVFRFDDLLERWDLHMTTTVTWKEYIVGKSIEIPSLDDGNGPWEVVALEPFPRMEVPIVVPNKGVAGRGDLYISLEWLPPSRECWDSLDTGDKNTIIGFLNALSA